MPGHHEEFDFAYWGKYVIASIEANKDHIHSLEVIVHKNKEEIAVVKALSKAKNIWITSLIAIIAILTSVLIAVYK